MILEYTAPKLTKYGKITEFIQAGSVIATGDVTGDGVSDTLFDTDGDGVGDLVVGGANGGQTNVTQVVTPPMTAILYDADGDNRAGIGSIGEILIPSSTSSFTFETAEQDGWDDPDRD